jgi:hypothetical protein
MGYTDTMKVTADEHRRVTLPKPVQAGDVFDIEHQANGRLVLTKLDKPARPVARLVRRGDLLLLTSPGKITWEETPWEEPAAEFWVIAPKSSVLKGQHNRSRSNRR